MPLTAQIMNRQLVCPQKKIPAGWIKVDASTGQCVDAGFRGDNIKTIMRVN